MRLGQLVSAGFLSLAALAVCLSATITGAQTDTILYDFNRGSNGQSPSAGLLPDGHGNYFGVTLETSNTYGTVFELSPASGGDWTLPTIYTFQGGNDGAEPNATLVMDTTGNLYGETWYGGNGKSLYCSHGCGTVFELSPNAQGGWTKSTLYNFQGNPPGSSFFDGAYPMGGLVLDKAGNLYGTTDIGGEGCSIGAAGCGVVFELNRNSSGAWVETILHNFNGAGGAGPQGGVIFDSLGNLYGTTDEGGPNTLDCYYGCGTVFKLSHHSGGNWSASVLHIFNGSNGSSPDAGLVIDSKGNLFGTTFGGGAFGAGVVFELERSGSAWKEVPVFQFSTRGGYSPSTPVTVDSHGDLYGTTPAGPAGDAICPAQSGCGVVFKLTQSSGKWQGSTVYAFKGQPDGFSPAGPVTIGSDGTLFGVTAGGGTANTGTIYEIIP